MKNNKTKPTNKLINLLFSITCANVLLFWFRFCSSSLLLLKRKTFGSISLISVLFVGLIKGFIIVIIVRVIIANVILKLVNIVSVTGRIPICSSKECPLEDTNNAAEEEYPICQIT